MSLLLLCCCLCCFRRRDGVESGASHIGWQGRGLNVGPHRFGRVLKQEPLVAELQPVERELNTNRLGAEGAASLCAEYMPTQCIPCNVHTQCTRGAHAVHMQCTRTAHAAHTQRTRSAHACMFSTLCADAV